MEARKELLKQAQKVYLDDCATIFLYELPRYVAYSNRLQNYGTYSLGHWKLATMWLLNNNPGFFGTGRFTTVKRPVPIKSFFADVRLGALIQWHI